MKKLTITLIALIAISPLFINNQSVHAQVSKKYYGNGDTLVLYTKPMVVIPNTNQRMRIAPRTNSPLSNSVVNRTKLPVYAVYYQKSTQTQFYRIGNKWIVSATWKGGFRSYVRELNYGG